MCIRDSFGTTRPSAGMILRSLATFVNSISTSQSRFDNATHLYAFNYRFGDTPGFSDKENIGMVTFIEHCSACHGGSLNEEIQNEFQFDNLHVANNGLELDYEDHGMATHTNNPSDVGVFKIPGLRNIELTAPYMHDGRFDTLEEVIDFYSEGIQDHTNLSRHLKAEDGQPKKMNLTQEEKDGLIALLQMLTDDEMTQEDKWSDPFLR